MSNLLATAGGGSATSLALAAAPAVIWIWMIGRRPRSKGIDQIVHRVSLWLRRHRAATCLLGLMALGALAEDCLRAVHARSQVTRTVEAVSALSAAAVLVVGWRIWRTAATVAAQPSAKLLPGAGEPTTSDPGPLLRRWPGLRDHPVLLGVIAGVFWGLAMAVIFGLFGLGLLAMGRTRVFVGYEIFNGIIWAIGGALFGWLMYRSFSGKGWPGWFRRLADRLPVVP